MKETIAEVVAAGAFLVAPHHAEQPAVADAVPQMEVIIDDRTTAPAQCTQSEHAGPIPAESVPVQAAGFEAFDPNSISFWLELSGSGLGLAGITTALTSRGLKGSLRKNHETITENGREAHAQLSLVLEAAIQQANGLRDDDVTGLRGLIEKHSATSATLYDALCNTGMEFDAERQRFFPLKSRLGSAKHAAIVVKKTEMALRQAKKLRAELDRVQTDLGEIKDNIKLADDTVATLHGSLNTLTQKGWDVSAYARRAASCTDKIQIARDKHTENYLEEPVAIVKDVIAMASDLDREAGTLESRRAAADETYATQSDRLTAVRGTAEQIREQLTALKETYNPGCLAGFEKLDSELVETLATLISAHVKANAHTGEKGKSVESVQTSEELIQSFDEAAEEIQGMQTSLEEREKHLTALVTQLPREITKLGSRFDRALNLADDPDVKGKTADEIRSLIHDVARLREDIKPDGTRKPNYLDIEGRHLALAEELDAAHTAAADQKQEMHDLRGNIPQLKDGYNNLVAVMKNFGDSKAQLQVGTRNGINQLKAYGFEVATDREGLRNQEKHLKELLKYMIEFMEQAEGESSDYSLLPAAKVVGGSALTIAGVELG